MGESARESARLDLFRYLTADERDEYIAIMSHFTSSLLADMSAASAAEQLTADGIPLAADTAESRCKQLVRWGNLVPSLRDTRVTTVADYLRARSRYQVSSLGGRVHRGALDIMSAADGAREVARELLGQIAYALAEIPHHLTPVSTMKAGNASRASSRPYSTISGCSPIASPISMHTWPAY
jgi:hypothetical protein